MKNILFLLALTFLLANSACKVELLVCTKAEGEIETRTIELDEINSVVMGMEGEIIITEGPIQEIKITTYSNVIDKIESDSKINGERWDIDIKGCSDVKGIKIEMTLPAIKHVEINGDAQIRTAGVFNNVDELKLEISGDGEIDFKIGTATKVDMKISGNGLIHVSGITTDQNIDISGDSTIRTADLKSDSTVVDVSGFGDCEIWVENSLTGKLSGEGKICYLGNPTISFDQSGAFEILDCN